MRTPIIFLIFNRPELTKLVFAEIAKVKPDNLLVVADGPRPDRPEEIEKCFAAREIVEQIDWDCKVLKNYSDVNLGCGNRVSSGLIWAFENVEEAIILEDDTMPHPTFFRFCDELLEKYRDDERVMHISGSNLQLGRVVNPYSYYFSRYDHIWGWATWRRAFKYYDYNMYLWETLKETLWLTDLLGNSFAAEWWRKYFDVAKTGNRMLYDSWDCQWLFSLWAQSGLSITPMVNLVSNLGFGKEAAHTKCTDNPLSAIPMASMVFPLQHPPYMIRDMESDQFSFKQACEPNENGAQECWFKHSMSKLHVLLRIKLKNVLHPAIEKYRASRNILKEKFKTIPRMQRVIKILLFKILYRSDYERWNNPNSLETWWDSRTEKMAQLIPKRTRVIEFGAGRRQLENFMDHSCTYVPSDIVDRGPGTIIIDLNLRPFPDLSNTGADVAFFAGVLEYVRDLRGVIEWLSEQVSFCVVSYAYVVPNGNIFKKYRERLFRLNYGYMNDYTEEDLLELFKECGFNLTGQENWTSQRIYLFHNKNKKVSLNN